jgi:hypothetical protein
MLLLALIHLSPMPTLGLPNFLVGIANKIWGISNDDATITAIVIVLAPTLFHQVTLPRLCKKQAEHISEDIFPPPLFEHYVPLGHSIKSCLDFEEFPPKPFESRAGQPIKSSS